MAPLNDSGRGRSTGSWALGQRRCTALLCAVFLIAGAHAAQAGMNVWTTHGPHGASVTALAIDPTTPNTLYAGTYGGRRVFHSTDR
jgi:hypothetical protein